MLLISHSNKFIFIHNYKAAGSSVTSALMGVSAIKPSIFSMFNAHPKIYTSDFPHHIKAAALKERIPEEMFNTYYKFGFVRNPWDWQVSLYNYMAKEKSHPQHALITGMKNFDEYIDWRINKDLHLQKEFFYDKEGKLLMDYIGKYETLREDFNKICERIHVKASLPHMKKSKDADNLLKKYSDQAVNLVYKTVNRVSQKIHINASLPALDQRKKSESYLKYYNEETIDKIYEAFKEDIETFGYSKPKLQNASSPVY